MKIDELVTLMNDAFNDDKTFTFPINGTSMLPFLRTNDLVELKKDNIYKKNDIVFYKRNDGNYILHRIIKKEDDYFILRGDHQNIKEYPIYNNQILGKVIRVIRNDKDKSLKGIKYILYLFTLKFWIFRKIYGRMK